MTHFPYCSTVIVIAGGTSVTGALECPSAEKRMIVSLDTSQMVGSSCCLSLPFMSISSIILLSLHFNDCWQLWAAPNLLLLNNFWKLVFLQCWWADDLMMEMHAIISSYLKLNIKKWLKIYWKFGKRLKIPGMVHFKKLVHTDLQVD